MDKSIIVLSGMPASGKDTITSKLCEIDKRIIPFKKYRSVGCNDKLKDTYFNVSEEEFLEKAKKDDFLQYHSRYGRYYGIAKDTLFDCFSGGKTPVIHIGRIENYYMLKKNMPSFEKQYGINANLCHIQLWETREVLKNRIILRDIDKEEINKRICAMNQEFEDNIAMMLRNEKPFSLVIRNSNINKTCDEILSYIFGHKTNDNGYDEFWTYLSNCARM